MNLFTRSSRIVLGLVVIAVLGLSVQAGLLDSSDEADANTNQSNVKTIKTAIALYKFRNNGQPPKKIADVVGDYLSEVPKTPSGKDYGYDPKTGRVWIPAGEPGAPSADSLNRTALRKAVIEYRRKHSQWPAKLDDLTPEFIKDIPKTQAGKAFVYDPKTGRVLLLVSAPSRSLTPDEKNQIETDTKSLASMTQLYKFKTTHLPESLEKLVEEGYLAEAPLAPAGGQYVMDKEGKWSYEPPAGGFKAPTCSEEEAKKKIVQIQQIASFFKAKEGRFPTSVAEMVDKNYLPGMPPAPEAKGYALDAKTGKVSLADAAGLPKPKSNEKHFKSLRRHEIATIESDIRTFQTAMALYKFKTGGEMPVALEDLVPEYMDQIPELPGGRQWLYDADKKTLGVEGEPQLTVSVDMGG